VRPPGDTSRAPLRVVLDGYLRTPPDARHFAAFGPDENGGPVHVLCKGGADRTRYRALNEAGAIVHELHGEEGDKVSLRDAWTWMWEQGVRRVLVEAGPTLLRRTIDDGFVDQVRVYTGAVNGGRGDSLADALMRLELAGRMDRESGGDAVLEGFVDRHPRGSRRRDP
jgi:diaminohydroxyphosphoribosylaminopyrimidine deaminase/5-amino-6-(5-phosphoribosylamino)uracil reductase